MNFQIIFWSYYEKVNYIKSEDYRSFVFSTYTCVSVPNLYNHELLLRDLYKAHRLTKVSYTWGLQKDNQRYFI